MIDPTQAKFIERKCVEIKNSTLSDETATICTAIWYLLRIVEHQQTEIEELRKAKKDASALDMFNPGDIMKAAFKK